MKLKPCPFCGSHDIQIEQIESLFGTYRKSAGCNTEGCMGYQSSTNFATFKEATKAWNKRKVLKFKPSTKIPKVAKRLSTA